MRDVKFGLVSSVDTACSIGGRRVCAVIWLCAGKESWCRNHEITGEIMVITRFRRRDY
jgi:hypothetical protein